MQANFDFRTIKQRGQISTPSPVRVGMSSVDRDGFVVEGAKPPILASKPPPFSISFSHETPADLYPQSKDFFELEGDCWETADVFSGRSSLRNLARCYLFPADDYYCRDFIIDAAFLKGKLFLQRHPDDVIAQQTEGFGIMFERAMTAKRGNSEAHAFNEFVTYPVGDHAILMRCETDCLHERTKEAIGLSTKKVKKNKRGGYYDLGTANYYQEQWLQMVLSGVSLLIVGSREESPADPENARIIQLHTFTVQQLAEQGGLDGARQREVFEGLASILSWIKNCFATAVDAGLCPTDQLAQARILFSKTGNRKHLQFVLLAEHEHADFLPEVFVQAVVDQEA